MDRLSEMDRYFYLMSNNFCEDVPTELQALSSGISYFYVTAGNNIGDTCCEILPDKFTCAPTPR